MIHLRINELEYTGVYMNKNKNTRSINALEYTGVNLN